MSILYRAKWMLPALVVTILIYAVGLHGPFVFDDTPNIVDPVGAWLHGQIDWLGIIMGNGSGLVGRQLSMLSFLANAALTGLDPYWFKAANLTLHLACGILVFVLWRSVLQHDKNLRTHSDACAGIAAALWLVHPLQVSTVLYFVQRMAQLSALFVLVALLLYLRARAALDQGRLRSGNVMLFAATPLAMLAAVLSKENGALAPLLCAVLEIGCFGGLHWHSKPRAVRIFFAVFLLAPTATVTAWYLGHLRSLLDGYTSLNFTLAERLLSEPRVVCDYLGVLLFPSGPSLGVYRDDFAVSRSLFELNSTLPAIVAITALLCTAFWLRKKMPSFFIGIVFYFAAHAMESTIFPLELYFEHRNYLPSVGFFLAIVALADVSLQRVLTLAGRPERAAIWLNIGSALIFCALAAATYARAGIWSSFHLIALQGVQQHPGSTRAMLDYAISLQRQQRYDEVERVFDLMAHSSDPAARHIAAIDTVALHCMTHGKVSEATLGHLKEIETEPVQVYEMLSFNNLSNFISEHQCEGLSSLELAEIIAKIVDASPQRGDLVQVWRSRFIAAKLFVDSGKLEEAQGQLAKAWATGAADPPIGVFLATVCSRRKDLSCARDVLSDVRRRVPFWDKQGQLRIAQLDKTLSQFATQPAPAL